ncbi:MAG: 30S ribosomal protein S3 [Deltaproteobacteria bacterium]|nr:30S ribosomal protein S3 [Deltaproteobacteria bacterium]
MGRKVHPIGFRIGVIQDWQAKWYADTHYAESLHEDLKLRRAIQSKYADAAISLVEIDRQAKEVSVTIYTARPGIVIGRGGQRVDELSVYLEKLVGRKVRLNIQEVRQPELDATLVARTIAEQIQRRIAYRRAMKQAIFRTMQAGAKGIRVNCSGRLGDAEIARRQTMHDGQVPLHTLRADIDYGFTEAHTTMGRIGIKVWIFKGEILPEPKELPIEGAPAEVAVEAEAATEPATEAQPEEEMVEPAAGVTGEAIAETAPEAAVEEKAEEAPAKPSRRRKPAAPAEEKPAEAEAVEKVEATAEEKPAAKRRTRTAKSAEVEEPASTKTAEATAEEKIEKKPAKKTAKRSQKAKSTGEPVAEAEAFSVTEDEEKDATAEEG